uniref:Uncharacterized protein n=1 Tax=Rhizophora mucronata TaxID=61149 RepID=A0A2P2PCE8_RHIMU
MYGCMSLTGTLFVGCCTALWLNSHFVISWCF